MRRTDPSSSPKPPTAAQDDPGESTEAAPRAPRRKKKRRRARNQASTLRPPLDTAGRERPRFLLNFPIDPELEPLIEAYERGDFASVRREAPALAERTKDDSVRAAALELRRRIDPDPLLAYLLLIAVGLLAFLTIYMYASRGH